MHEIIDCTRCGYEMEKIEAFPGGLCVYCYEKEFDKAETGKSAEQKARDIKDAFGKISISF